MSVKRFTRVPTICSQCDRRFKELVSLRAYLNGPEIVEEAIYSCSHKIERVVSHVLPASHFAAIERRITSDEPFRAAS